MNQTQGCRRSRRCQFPAGCHWLDAMWSLASRAEPVPTHLLGRSPRSNIWMLHQNEVRSRAISKLKKNKNEHTTLLFAANEHIGASLGDWISIAVFKISMAGDVTTQLKQNNTSTHTVSTFHFVLWGITRQQDTMLCYSWMKEGETMTATHTEIWGSGSRLLRQYHVVHAVCRVSLWWNLESQTSTYKVKKMHLIWECIADLHCTDSRSCRPTNMAQ